jgi:hypothetical protein
MPRLGSVLGAILAEIERARLIADQLTKDLVAEYRSDTVLSSMTVPRVALDQAELTLKFAVSDVIEEEPAVVSTGSMAELVGRRVASTILPEVLEWRGLSESERQDVAARLTGSRRAGVRVPARIATDALAGKFATSTRATADAVLKGWDELPSDVRTKLGTKTEFRQDLESRLARELPSLVGRANELELVKAALASRIEVAVASSELPTQADQIQELKLMIRGEDVSLIIEGSGGA